MERQLPWVILFSLALLGASLLFVPATGQLALVRYKSQQYSEALRGYEAALARGDDSVETIRGLADLHIHYGEVQKAIAVVEAYVRQNPNDVGALQRLGRYYQYDQRYQDYTAVLERLRAIDPTPDTLRKLAQIYNRLGRIEAQIRVLQKLVALPGAAATDFLDLARLLAGRQRVAEAVDTLQRLRALQPLAFTKPAAMLLSSLHATNGRPEAAVQVALAWLQDTGDLDAATEFADTLAARAGQAASHRFLAAAHERHPERVEIEVRLAQAEAALGAREAALARLLAIQEKARLPGWGLDTAVALALDLDRLDTALRLGRERPAALLEGTLRDLVATAVQVGKAQAAGAVVSALGTEALRATPVLAARLAIALGRIDQANTWADRALASDLELTPRFELVEVLVRLERRGDALAHLTATLRGDTPDRLPGWALRQAAGLYLEFDAARQGLPVFADLRRRRPDSIDAAFGWAALAARLGREPAVLAWWADVDKERLDNQHLDDLFYAARGGDAHRFALAVGERRVDRQPEPVRKRELALTLLDLDRPMAALDRLRPLIDDPQLVDRAGVKADYVTALRAALAAGNPVSDEARAVALAGLQAPGSAPGAQDRYLDLLLAAGAHRAALPFLASRAVNDPATWVPTYVDTARKAGSPDAAVALLDRLLDRPGLPRDQRSQFVYSLIDLDARGTALPHARTLAEREAEGWRDQYINLLAEVEGREAVGDYLVAWARDFDGDPEARRALAQRLLAFDRKEAAVDMLTTAAAAAPPGSPAVSELLWLWGPRPPESGLTWLTERLRTAEKRDDRAAWARLLNQRGGAARMLRVVAAPDRPGHFDPLTEAIIDGLLTTGPKARLRSLLERALATAPDLPRRQRVGDLAFQAAMPELAARAYDQVLAVDPGRLDAVRNRGQIAFFRGDWDRADALLGRHLAERPAPDDFRSRYQLAEVRYDRGRRGDATRLYQEALAIIDDRAAPELDARITRALILRRTASDAAADAAFSELVQDARARRAALPHYLRMLLDTGRLGRIGDLLAARGS